MPIIKRLTDRIDEKRESDDTLKPRAIFTTLLEVVKDGDVDAEDYDDLVDAVKDLIAFSVPLINIPYVPSAVEATMFDPLVIPLAQSFADEAVAAAYQVFDIDLPEGR